MTATAEQVGRPRAGRWIAAASAALLGVCAVLAPAGPATAAPPAPGTVLTSATATLPPELAPLATAKRITYVTTDVEGRSTVSSGLVLTPTSGRTYRTVAWGHGTTGLADHCAPSVNRDVFWPEARAAIAELLERGWTVAASDYPGLGTPGLHPYLVGGSTGRALIDSVKAARNLDPALTTQYAVDGHSQGGQGALFAGELAPSYDGPLELRGVAAVAPVSNLDLIAPFIPGEAEQGYLVMALYGLAAVETSLKPFTVLALPAQLRVPVLQTGCLYQILDSYEPLSPAHLVKDGTVPNWVLTKLAQYGNPAQSPPSAPILIVQGTADTAVPSTVTEILVEQLGDSQPVTYVELEGATHDGAVTQSAPDVAAWIATRFGQ